MEGGCNIQLLSIFFGVRGGKVQYPVNIFSRCAKREGAISSYYLFFRCAGREGAISSYYLSQCARKEGVISRYCLLVTVCVEGGCNIQILYTCNSVRGGRVPYIQLMSTCNSVRGGRVQYPVTVHL